MAEETIEKEASKEKLSMQNKADKAKKYTETMDEVNTKEGLEKNNIIEQEITCLFVRKVKMKKFLLMYVLFILAGNHWGIQYM